MRGKLDQKLENRRFNKATQTKWPNLQLQASKVPNLKKIRNNRTHWRFGGFWHRKRLPDEILGPGKKIDHPNRCLGGDFFGSFFLFLRGSKWLPKGLESKTPAFSLEDVRVKFQKSFSGAQCVPRPLRRCPFWPTLGSNLHPLGSFFLSLRGFKCLPNFNS